MPITGLLHAFSVKFSGRVPAGPNCDRFSLITMEHPDSWTVVRATPTSTAYIVALFVSEEILHRFRPLKLIVSDDAGCVTAEDI